jgi:hypothetical protein
MLSFVAESASVKTGDAVACACAWDHEEQGNQQVADYRRGRNEQPDDNEQTVSAKARSQPVGEEGDLFVSGIGPDEPGVQCVLPEQVEKSAGDEQGQSVS